MLVLASTSRYRADLLSRLGLPFETFAPGVDEQRLAGEAPDALAARLAGAKAAAARARYETGLAIGSDQVAVLDGETLGKPGNHANAVAQLTRMSRQTVEFLTAVAVVDLADGSTRQDLARTRVRFRALDAGAITSYLEREPAFDCAGSFKSEGLGITLVSAIEEDDPTALVGLPLIRLCALLRASGLAL